MQRVNQAKVTKIETIRIYFKKKINYHMVQSPIAEENGTF